MKLIDADAMRKWLWEHTVYWVKVPERAAAYEDAVDYLDDNEFHEELIITFHELKYGRDWFCKGSQSGIIGWSTESEQGAIDQYHRRCTEAADATITTTN